MITAKVVCNSKRDIDGGTCRVTFNADYADGRNKEWSKYTPDLTLSMLLTDEASGLFEAGKAYTLQFLPEDADA